MRFRQLLACALFQTGVVAMPAAAQVPAATLWEGKTIPIATFGQFPNLQRPLISPDGTRIAAKVRGNGVQMLAILPVGEGAKPVIVARDDDFDRDSVGEREVYRWQWIGSDNLLIFIRSRDNYMGQWYDNTRVAAYSVKSGKLTPLGWDKAIASAGNVLWTSPDDAERPHILLERQTSNGGTERLGNPEVIDIDVATGQYRVVVPTSRGVSGWTADESGAVRVGRSFDPDSGRQMILYRPGATGNFRTVSRERMSMHDDVAFPSLLLSGDGGAYAYSNHEGYRALYRYDLDRMALGAKVFGVDGYDIGGASVSPDGRALQAYHFTDSRGRTTYLDPTLKEIAGVLDEMFGAGNVAITSTDLKRQKVLFAAAELGQAPTYYVFDTSSGRVQRLAWSNDALRNARLNPVSTIRYRASDGQSIEAVLTMPRHAASRTGLPLIVMPHGGPWVRDDADWDTYQWAQALAENGYVVIQPNYRGSTGYGREFGRAVDGNWGNRMQDDLNDAVTHLSSRGIVDAKRVCMFGWSYGGYAASRAAQRDGDKYRCTISGAGVHDLPQMVAYDNDYLGRYRSRQALGAAGPLRDISPALHAEQFSAPILIVHGRKDTRVPVAQSRTLVSRLKAADKVEGRDWEYLEQPLNTHNLLREADRVELLERTLAFLKKHNPA